VGVGRREWCDGGRLCVWVGGKEVARRLRGNSWWRGVCVMAGWWPGATMKTNNYSVFSKLLGGNENVLERL
jgi:hypothetical protein